MRLHWRSDVWVWAVYTLAALLVSAQRLQLGFGANGYSAYENYRIFRNAFPHLMAGLNPYAAYPAEQWDLFKYSPAFAVGMGPFAALPDALGLPLWNLLNTLPLLWAMLSLPLLAPGQRRFLAWFALPELVVSLQNSQSNGLAAALILWTFIALERGRQPAAAAWTAAGAFLKIFGGFSAVLCWFYPGKWRFAASAAGWALLLALAPGLLLGPQQLAQVYQWWLQLLMEDHAASVGLSVQGWLETWFGWQPRKLWVTLSGLLLLGLSFWRAYPEGFFREKQAAPPPRLRLLALASVLLWVVVFNHKAESPTFVIAMCGVALWYLASERTLAEKILLGTTFALVSLSPTDLFPRALREQWVQPYVLKALPCIAIWALLCWEMLFFGKKRG
jgi:hypothetical protein